MRVYFILGTAAELIKMYPILLGLSKTKLEWYVWNTGQSNQSFWTQYDDFNFPRNRAFCLDKDAKDLDARRSALKWFGRNYFWSRKSLLKAIEKATGSKPAPGDLAFVHGDTLSTFLGSILAKRLGMKVAHVEAGMRSGRLMEPFPEEFIRRMVSRMAQYHFAPDNKAAENLKLEKRRGQISVSSGNSVYDSVHYALKKNRPSGLPRGSYVVCNLHRFENLHNGVRWKKLIDASLLAAQKHPVYFVMHPPTKARLEADPISRQKLLKAGVQLLDRLPYMRYIHMVSAAQFLITDSGSNQEECSYIGVPCLLLREHTERSEGLGKNCVLSRMDENIIRDFIQNPEKFRSEVKNLTESPSAQILNQLQLETAAGSASSPEA